MRRSEYPPQVRDGVTWYHRDYLFDLSQVSPARRLEEFRKMLRGSGYVAGVFVSTGMLALYQAEVTEQNNLEARAVAGTPAPTWQKMKIIHWRGCWCLRVSDARNKRRSA